MKCFLEQNQKRNFTCKVLFYEYSVNKVIETLKRIRNSKGNVLFIKRTSNDKNDRFWKNNILDEILDKTDQNTIL